MSSLYQPPCVSHGCCGPLSPPSLAMDGQDNANFVIFRHSCAYAFKKRRCNIHTNGETFLNELWHINKFPTVVAPKTNRQFALVTKEKLESISPRPGGWRTNFKLPLASRRQYETSGDSNDIISFIKARSKAVLGDENPGENHAENHAENSDLVRRMVGGYIGDLWRLARDGAKRGMNSVDWAVLEQNMTTMISYPACFSTRGPGGALNTAALDQLRQAVTEHARLRGTPHYVTEHEAALRATLAHEKYAPWLQGIVSSSPVHRHGSLFVADTLCRQARQ